MRQCQESGLLQRIPDGGRLKIDFLPYEDCTIQRYGVTWDNITYWHPVLSDFIGRGRNGRSDRYRFKRDPSDISKIYFRPPGEDEHISVPYSKTHAPPMSRWEARQARDYARGQGNKVITEDRIFEACNELRRIEAETAHKSKKARRSRERRKLIFNSGSETIKANQ